MPKPYHLLLLTDNSLITKIINSFCNQPQQEDFCQIIIEKSFSHVNQCDAILVSQDKIELVLSGENDYLSLPFIYLNEEKHYDQSISLIKTRVDEVIDMDKITAIGFFRAIKTTLEKFYINSELNKQKNILRQLTGYSKNEIFKKHGTTIVESAKSMMKENKYLIDMIKKQNEELKKLARVDVLTKVGNRVSFDETLTAMISHSKRHKHMLAVLMIDLDKFKNVNDTYGHQAGDFLLQSAADRLQHTLRKGDFIARMGGDEFAIILNEIKSPHAAGLVAWKIIQEIAKPFDFNNIELRVDVSIGIACYPLIGENFEDLVKNADMAMYQAKKSHVLKYAFANMDIHTDHVKKIKVEYELKVAIERNELTMVYQPIYEIPSQRLHGFEALIRWNSKNLGHISPGEFIPIAEDTGLIYPISKWVLQTVCKQISTWKDIDIFPYRISVNLSPSQLIEANLLELVTTTITDNKIPLNLIEFEITEMAAMQENPEASATIKSLCKLGATHALDDFGTGYSSIKHLRLLPISTIKIDQSFVQGLGIQKADESIVSSIISLAKKMNLKVVAEGVETEEQLKFLLTEGCDYIQGYLFSKPLTADLALKLIESEKLKTNV